MKRILAAFADLLLIQACFLLSYLVRSIVQFPYFERALHSYLDIAWIITPLQLVILYVYGLYHVSPYARLADILSITAKGISVGTIVIVFTAFFARAFALPRSIVLIYWLLAIIILSGWRGALLYYYRIRSRPKRALIYGTGPLAQLVYEELKNRPHLSYRIEGFIRGIAEPSSHSQAPPGPLLGGVEDLQQILKKHRVDEVIFAPEARSEEELKEVARRCKRGLTRDGGRNARLQHGLINTQIAPELFEFITGEAHLGHFDHLSEAALETLVQRNWYLGFKRVMDVILAAILLVLALPLMGVIALVIKLTSKGPLIFRQARVGRHGRRFTMFKFRSMPSLADQEKEEYDFLNNEGQGRQPTRIGAFLRRFELDELPQLVNVLKGEMSLIGPRAEWDVIAKRMEEEISWYGVRHLIRPGMTGWAQVEFKYTTSIEEYRRKLRYDLFYIKNLSLALDLKIMLRTVWMILSGKGH